MKVLMVGVDDAGRGGMWTVVENYLQDSDFRKQSGLCYMPTATAGSAYRRITLFIKALFKINKELRRGGYDIVHMHLSERASVYRKDILQRMAKKAGCKTVIHMHGADFEMWYKALNPSRQAYVREVLGRADCVLILGEYWGDFIGSLLKEPGRIRVLHNAVPVPQTNPYSIQARHMVFLGAMIERKGILDLLEAMKRIRDKLPQGTKLILCGDDPDGIAIPAIDRLKIQDLVECKGWINNQQKAEVMAVSAVNVLPSYREGLPMTILETMAKGIPNITTNIAAIPEAVTDGVNGFMLEPGDVEALSESILKLLRDETLRIRMSQAAWEIAYTDFSLKSHTTRILSIYKELLG